MKEVENSFVERRGWPRTIVDKVIDEAFLALPSETPGNAPRAEVVNLSEAGAGVLMPTKLARGASVKLQIISRNFPRLDFEAEVRWTTSVPVSTGKFPAGLKFMNLDEKKRSELASFMEILRKYRAPGSKG